LLRLDIKHENVSIAAVQKDLPETAAKK